MIYDLTQLNPSLYLHISFKKSNSQRPKSAMFDICPECPRPPEPGANYKITINQQTLSCCNLLLFYIHIEVLINIFITISSSSMMHKTGKDPTCYSPVKDSTS